MLRKQFGHISLIIIAMFLLHQKCHGQKTLVWNGINTETLTLARPAFVQDELQLQEQIQKVLISLWQNGYLGASVDSLVATTDTVKAYAYLGQIYRWQQLSLKDISLRHHGISSAELSHLRGQVYSPKSFEKICKQILDYYENHGYPFARVSLQDIEISDSNIAASIGVDLRDLTRIDSINIEGDVSIAPSFIYQQIGIKPGDLYSEKVMRDITRQLQAVRFISIVQPWRMSFGTDKNVLTLYLKDRSVNTADAIIGMAPSNSTFGNRFFVTGEVRLQLHNSLNVGESINIHWQNLQYKSPRLNVELATPFIFGTLFGAYGKFNYVKQDTNFSTVTGEAGVSYRLSSVVSLKLYWHRTGSTLIRVDTQFIKQQRRLPSNIDYATNAYGLQVHFNKLDNDLWPRRGNSGHINVNIGARRTLRNTQITQLYDVTRSETFNYLYDTLSTNTLRVWAQLFYQHIIPLGSSFGLRTVANGGYVANTTLARNDLFTIGGYRLLRGFDEASLFVNQYALVSVEPRVNLGPQAIGFLLCDAGYISLPVQGISKTVIGFGGGLSMTTRSGIFNIVYAFGNNSGTGVQLRDSKIHFGYVNQF